MMTTPTYLPVLCVCVLFMPAGIRTAKKLRAVRIVALLGCQCLLVSLLVSRGSCLVARASRVVARVS